MVAVTDHEWPGAEGLRAQLTAQLAVEARFPGWQILHTTCERWVRYLRIPEGYFYGVYFRLSEPPLMAVDLEVLAGLVEGRRLGTEEAMERAVCSGLLGSYRSSGDGAAHVDPSARWRRCPRPGLLRRSDRRP